MSRPMGVHPALIRRPVQDARATVRAVLLPEEMERARDLLRRQWPKQCGCGRSYSDGWPLVPTDPARWAALPLRYQRTDEFSTNEARDCACGSTLEIFLAIHDPEAM